MAARLVLGHRPEHQRGRCLPRDRADAGNVTPRQLRVLRAVLEAGTAKEGAVRLGLSVHSVNGYCHRAYRRLGVISLAQAVAKLDDEHPTWRKRRLDWLGE